MNIIQLPKYTTIEVKEFPLNPDYSGDTFSEYQEFCAARRKRDQNVYEYCVNKLGKNKVIRDYPTRMTVVIDGVRTYYHIESAHYSADTKQRVLISANELYDEITAIYQIAKDKNAK